MTRHDDEAQIQVAYAAGQPVVTTHKKEVPIEDNLYGVILGQALTLETLNGDPGYKVGETVDYDILLEGLITFTRIRFVIDGSDDVINIRSDTVAFLDALFREEPWDADVLPTGIVGATVYYNSWFVPFRCEKSQSKYKLEIDMSAEADMYTTVANAVLTDVTFTIENVYENYDYGVRVYDFQSNAINSASGVLLTQLPDDGEVLLGIIIKGEMEGTQDLTGILLKHEGLNVKNISIQTYANQHNQDTHGKILHSNYNNTVVIVLDRAIDVNSTTKLYIKTSAAQDFNITYIYLKDVKAGTVVSEEKIPVQQSQKNIKVGSRSVEVSGQNVLSTARESEHELNAKSGTRPKRRRRGIRRRR